MSRLCVYILRGVDNVGNTKSRPDVMEDGGCFGERPAKAYTVCLEIEFCEIALATR